MTLYQVSIVNVCVMLTVLLLMARNSVSLAGGQHPPLDESPLDESPLDESHLNESPLDEQTSGNIQRGVYV